MATAEPDLPVHHFAGADGTELAYRELGSGRLLVLIHGFVSTGYVNWIKYGHAKLLASAGYRVVMPDLRAHGDSAKPHDPAAYPPDILTDDGFALLDHLGVDPAAGGYDLGGYSLGSRTSMRMLVRGARPDRAVLSGMGLSRMLDLSAGVRFYRRMLENYGTFKHGEPEFMAQAFVRTVGGDPEALLLAISANVPTPIEQIRAIAMPTLVLLGDRDDDHGSGRELAATLVDGTYATIPGNHMGAVARPEMGQAIAEFLD
ncbi:MAG TPA: alpha/beta fold hydrolase [Marmoricola sp.]